MSLRKPVTSPAKRRTWGCNKSIRRCKLEQNYIMKLFTLVLSDVGNSSMSRLNVLWTCLQAAMIIQIVFMLWDEYLPGYTMVKGQGGGPNEELLTNVHGCARGDTALKS